MYDRAKDVILHTLKGAFAAAAAAAGGYRQRSLTRRPPPRPPQKRSDGCIAFVGAGHTKRITDVAFHPVDNFLYTASQDKTVRIWHAEGSGAFKSHIVKTHKGEVTGLALHPSNDYLLTVSLDSTWALSDARGGELLCQSTHADVTKGTAAALAGGGSAWLDGRSLTPTRCGFVPPPPPPPPPRPRDARRDRVHGGQIPPGRQAAGCRHGGRDGAHLGRPIPDDGSGLAGPPWQRDQPGVFRKRVRGMSFFLLQVTDPLGLTWPPARPAHTPRPHAHRDCRYHLAVTGENNEVKLWDLRKLANFKTLTLAANETANAVAFDHSASYLAIGGNSVQYVVAWAVAPRTRHVAQVGWLTLLTQCPVVLLDGWYPLQRVRCEAVEPARGPGRRDGRRHRCGIWRGRQVCGLHEPGPLSPLPRAMSVVVVVVVVVAGSGRDRAPRPADE